MRKEFFLFSDWLKTIYYISEWLEMMTDKIQFLKEFNHLIKDTVMIKQNHEYINIFF